MAVKVFRDFESEVIGLPPKGVTEYGIQLETNVLSPHKMEVVENGGSRQLQISRPKSTDFSTLQLQRPFLFGTTKGSKGVDLFAVITTTRGFDYVGVFVADATKLTVNGGYGDGIYTRVRPDGTGEVALMGVGPTGSGFGGPASAYKPSIDAAVGVRIAVRMRVENYGANQIVRAKAWLWSDGTTTEPAAWDVSQTSNVLRGKLDAFGWAACSNNTDAATTRYQYLDLFSAIELENGTETAVRSAGGRRLVPVGKW